VIKPQSLDLTILCDHDFIDYVSFDDHYFKNRQGYNELMLWDGFYEKFLKFEYILIYQLDAFVFNDQLIEWCDKNYDYIGAPWLRSHPYIDVFKAVKSHIRIFLHTCFNIKQPLSDLPTEIQYENKVGNGGFSLRRVRKFYDACKKYKAKQAKYINRPEHHFNEDVWWAIELNRKSRAIKIPGYKKAIFFSFENEPRRAMELTGGTLPFGCHAWNLHMDFWRNMFIKENVFEYRKNARLHAPPYNYTITKDISELELVIEEV
jgi:hypothetical protein